MHVDSFSGDQRISMVRYAVRVLPVNSRREVLLLHCINPAAPSLPYWVSIGGGIEKGEDERVAAVRELWEETAILLDASSLRGPVHREVVEISWGQYDYTQHQSYFTAEVIDTLVSFEHMEQIELDTTLGYRWWSLADLHSTAEHVLPNVLAIIERVLVDY